MDTKLYWKQLRELEHALTVEHPDGGVYVLHLESGRVSTASPYVAAGCIVRKTHRRADDAEIAAYKEDQLREADRIAAKARRFAVMNAQPEGSPNARVYR